MQDVLPKRYNMVSTIINLLKTKFGDKLISRDGLSIISLQRYVILHLLIISCGAVKSGIIDISDANIFLVIHDIRLEMLKQWPKIQRPEWASERTAVVST